MFSKSYPAHYLLIQFLAVVATFGYAAEPEEAEPPLKYKLLIDGKPFDISEDKPIRIAGDFKNPEVTFKVDPHRTFNYAGVTFRYPRHFTFEPDVADKVARAWIMSGNTFKLTLEDVEGDPTPTGYANGMARRLGKDKWKVLNGTLKSKLGQHVLEGVSAKWDLVPEHPIHFEIYRLEPFRGRTRLLVLQDTRSDGKPSKEGVAAIAMLKESFAITRK